MTSEYEAYLHNAPMFLTQSKLLNLLVADIKDLLSLNQLRYFHLVVGSPQGLECKYAFMAYNQSQVEELSGILTQIQDRLTTISNSSRHIPYDSRQLLLPLRAKTL